jgi:hypothetical protein
VVISAESRNLALVSRNLLVIENDGEEGLGRYHSPVRECLFYQYSRDSFTARGQEKQICADSLIVDEYRVAAALIVIP